MVRQATHEGLHHLHDIGVGATDRAVLFDADGVLVDSYPAYRRIWSRWATHRNLDPDLVWSHTHGRRPIHPGDELAGAHHRVDTFSDTIPLIADWLDSTHP
jgi:beta-phosphoglucomutase-like phosphatase (HAD superfamily)